MAIAWAFWPFTGEIGDMEKQTMTSKEAMPGELSR
jgi:hypothetical protein